MSESTKAQSYRREKSRAGRRLAKIGFFVARNPGASRNDIAQALGMRIQSVCAPVNTLVKAGILVSRGTKKDPGSGAPVACLYPCDRLAAVVLTP